jgi:hypothetical protein
MKKNTLVSTATLALAASLAPTSFAATATTLGSFQGVEEPTTVYNLSTGNWSSDGGFQNITNPSAGQFKMELRFNGTTFDCDDNSSHDDRGRAEVKGLGTNQAKGETFDYIMSMKTSSNWKNASGFAHVFQLFTVNNTSSVGYMAQINLAGTQNQGKLLVNPRSAGTSYDARTFTFTPGVFATYRIQVKGSADGYVRMSINNDALSGMNADMTVAATYTGYRPKWGLYRRFDNAPSDLGNTHVELTNVQSNKVTVTAPQNYSWEAENLTYTTNGDTAVEDADTTASNDARVNFRANGTGDWIEFDLPSVAAGTYQVKLQYKSHTSRGRCTFRMDGATIGGTMDQYASTSTYPNTTIATVTFATAGTHKLRLTVSCKNSASSGYYLSADKITLTGQ